jgi:hypothetical protein
MARPTAGGSGTRTTLVPLPHTRSTRWPCSSPRSAMSALVASKIRKPSRPSIATSAIARIRRLAGGCEQGLELQMGEPQGRRFGGHRRAAHVLGGRMLQYAIKDAGPVEPGRDREPPGHGGRLEPADLLHPPDVQLQVRTLSGQRVQAALGAPGQVAAQVGFGAVAGGAREAGQVGSYCQPQPVSERRQRMGGH